MFNFSVTQTEGRKVGKVNLEDCRQILEKIGKTENLLEIDNLNDVIGSSPIYQVPKLIEAIWISTRHDSLRIHQLPAIYMEMQNLSKDNAQG